MMVVNSRKHHCYVRTYTREVLVLSKNIEIQTKHYPLAFRNRRGDEARIKKTWDMKLWRREGYRFSLDLLNVVNWIWVDIVAVVNDSVQTRKADGKDGKLSRKRKSASYGKRAATGHNQRAYTVVGGSSQAMDSQASGIQTRKSARKVDKEPTV
ncbi:hypothetical protein Tco_1530937 [Tanacetum coccineum]